MEESLVFHSLPVPVSLLSVTKDSSWWVTRDEFVLTTDVGTSPNMATQFAYVSTNLLTILLLY